ncbi:tol-pal system-associated acyl-CoA thioesterase [Teredinibacter sp. KSP-S5-2]|uniref:tol-pal system-associated acyl-CoA thioesterase n=1 Tax=Teredinibacter sp. KSP-S5-2 TaxID=3034506 RepID=UPI002935177D|nr:tol-pal system-associated acyl-CoA thioesterase [Teredinibacter sp. KSP-S5-2]WNO08114.1 tol-pal system-associated acyl-CoA thioesterase [Teredinibacter sp. KSP-S5-2]
MTNEFSINIRVYIEDTDAGGIVYYPNYLKFMERSRTEFLRELGFPKAAFIADGFLVVVASAQIDYRRSAKLDDEIQVTTFPEKVKRGSIIMHQKVLRDGQVLAEGRVRVACINEQTAEPAPLPTELVLQLNKYLEEFSA